MGLMRRVHRHIYTEYHGELMLKSSMSFAWLNKWTHQKPTN